MDIRASCDGSEIDPAKPYPAFFNYNGEPEPRIIKANLIAVVDTYRQDFTEEDDDGATATLRHFDTITNEGSATVHYGVEEFNFRLCINPDIARGSSVRVSSPESVNYGAYGVLVDAANVDDVWTVEMLDGGKVHYQRDELADLERNTTIGGGELVTAVEVPATFEIGEYVLYNAGPDRIGRPISEDKVVQIVGRRYIASTYKGAEWSYRAVDVEDGIAAMDVGERSLSKLPRNLQNLTIIQRPG